jgi:Ras association domain-containing protein 1
MADVSELIEMTSFHSVPLAEGDLEHQSGRGHDFVCVASFNPTWCDLCRDLIWGLYDAGAMRCANCNLTCHEKCKSKVQLNCTAYERPASPPSSSSSSSASSLEMSTLANISTIMDEEASDDMDDEEGTLKGLDMDLLVASMNNTDLDDLEAASSLTEAPEDTTLVEIDEEEEDSQIIPPEQLQSAIMLYNDGFPPGQETFFEPAGTCKGFIRVRMNLSRPINVLPGQMATSVLNLTLDSNTDKSSDKPSLTSFYLPHETEKALCVTSVTTTHDVIRTLLAKFRIVDNPHKYVMYERRPFQRRRSSTGGDSTVTISGSIRSRATLGRINLRRLENAERPLMIALNNSLKDEQKIVFVLQENDPGEITWNEFTMPELKNFLLILDREEAWYKRKIHEKYEIIHQHLGKLAEQKRAEEEAAAAAAAAAAEAKNA